ncbi:unnamed protein product [Ostreobium quekettii]|uniref:Uncharacterized protein n=1 Tax=Ostreobium quekettii TaxID=121088 RepID=A0A8S1J6C4_9CHLO|nr:unnamed protein product [Ostreobium quekettii]
MPWCNTQLSEFTSLSFDLVLPLSYHLGCASLCLQVRPVLAKVKDTLLVCAGCLLLSTGALVAGLQGAQDVTREGPVVRTPKQVTLNGIIYSDRVRDLYELSLDSEAAQAEADAQGGVPGYCGDRYFRASAGGHFCEKFDQ